MSAGRNYAAIEILARYGLDANNITENDIDEHGYREVKRDESGAVIFDDWGHVRLEAKKPWLEGFPFEELLETIR